MAASLQYKSDEKSLKLKVVLILFVFIVANVSPAHTSNSNTVQTNFSDTVKASTEKTKSSTIPTTTPLPEPIEQLQRPFQLTPPDGGRKTEQYEQLENVLGSLDSMVSVFEVFQHLKKLADMFIETILDKFKHPFRTVLELLRLFEVPLPSDVSRQCQRHVRFFFRELLDTLIEQRNPMEEWSIQMLDATFKIPPGILRGTNIWPGSFTQCVDISVKNTATDWNEQEDTFVGEHCFLRTNIKEMLKLETIIPIFVSSAMCFPSTCNHDDKQKLINSLTSLLNVNVSVVDEMCHKKEIPPMDATAVIISLVLFIPVAAVVAAILSECWASQRINNVEILSERKDQFCSRFLSAFSLSQGWNMLFFENKTPIANFTFINGIRCFTIAWVLYGHVFVAFFFDAPWRELKELYDQVENINTAPILKGSLYAIETFLFLSGFSAGYFFLRWKQTKHISVAEVLMMYPKRYLRLTAPYAYAMAFVTGPWMYLGTGPFWYAVTKEASRCRSLWWKNILYIANLKLGYFAEKREDDYIERQCLEVTWYLMVEMQIFLIVPPLLLLLARKPRWAVITIVLLYFGLLGTRIYFTVESKIVDLSLMTAPPITNPTFPDLQPLSDGYRNTLVRANVYMLGMLHGYFMYGIAKTDIHLKRRTVMTGWALCVGITSMIIYGDFPFLAGYIEASYALSFFWCQLSTTLWCLPLAWIIFACSTGHGGMVTMFLSWQPFVVLGRLSYSIYLAHQIILLTLSGVATSSLQPDPFTLIGQALLLLIYSTAAATALYFLIESPIKAIRLKGENEYKSHLEPRDYIGFPENKNEKANAKTTPNQPDDARSLMRSEDSDSELEVKHKN